MCEFGKDRCEIWNGEQFQTVDQMTVAALLGLKPEQVTINMLYAGGSFGRRANPDSDYVARGREHRQGNRRPVIRQPGGQAGVDCARTT